MIFAPTTVTTLRQPSVFISPFTREGGYGQHVQAQGAPSSGTYAAINRAHYYPVYIPSGCVVYRLFWLNGATASTNNFQVGLYNADGTNGAPGTAVIRGTSTLASGANVCQFDNITDTAVGAGAYWLAIWGSGTTATLFRFTSAVIRHSAVYLESSLAGGLPATATPATAGSNAALYMFGLALRSTP